MSSNSPRSEKCDTRFSTPVPELDDHRLQPHSLPRADIIPLSQPRRATTRNGSTDHGLLQVDAAVREARFTSRDFEHEHAIVDDDQSVNDENLAPSALGSTSPTMLRRGTNRRSRNRQDQLARSRSSSSSSSSPPNSVEAFADPRRRLRANTLESKRPSDLDLLRNRSGSIGTSHQIPPVSAGSIARETRKGEDELAKEDICFPQYDGPGKTYKIDYEELEEFVASATETSIPDLKRNARKQSISHTVDPKGFHMSKGSKANNDAGTNLETSNCCADYVEEKPRINGYHLQPSDDEIVQKIASPDNSLSSETHQERFTFFSSEFTVTYHAEELGGLIGDGVNFRDLFELPPEGGVWWLDVVSPTEDEYWAIARAFGVHPLTSEDIIMQEDREKVELFKDYYLVCFRTFSQESKGDNELEPVNIYMVVFREGVLSFSTAPNPHAAAVRKRMGKLRDYLALGSDWICYAMIDSIVDSFAPVIRSAEQESEAIEDQVFIVREDDYGSLLRQIGEARKKVLNMMRLLGGKADVIKGFAKRCNESFSIAPRGDIGLYLGDVQDHVVTMMSNLGHVEKMLSRSQGNYLAQLNVDGVMRGHEANRVLAKITLIGTVLVPMNLITGLFGMNVEVPGKESSSLAWFFGIIGVIAAFATGSLFIAKKMKYI